MSYTVIIISGSDVTKNRVFPTVPITSPHPHFWEEVLVY